ncbi:MAG: type II toxin-antitoxin system HicA family toxin [Gammaproteobacteria bacterium]|nr:type II toxin-antitoxin system HicA family toxin [Gammaproteobacteria bacterium]
MNCTFREVIDILLAHGFVADSRGATSHVRYRAVVSGQVRLVIVAAHGMNDRVPPGTLNSIIQQSGLSKNLFRK